MTRKKTRSDGRLSRRRVLKLTGAAVASSVAGCLGGGRDPGEQAPGQPLDAPVKGDPEAEVTVASYEDFGCGGCAHYHTEILPQVEEDFIQGGEICYEYHDFVLPANGETSWKAASAARAVQDHAGEDAFWTYTDRLFENQDSLGDAITEATEGLDVDANVVEEAAEEQAYDETVTHSKKQGEDEGVERTPSILVNCEPVEWESVEYGPVKEKIETMLNEMEFCQS